MGMLTSLMGGFAGDAAADGSQTQDEDARKAALAGILGTNVPTIAEQQVNPDLESVAGTYNPNMEGTVALGPSSMAGITTDPRLAQAQMSALQSLQQQGQGGLTATDRMNLMNINNQTEGDANASSNAIMQNMAARGMGGGGAELAARLMASQGAANRGAQTGMNVAAQSQQNALNALAQAGSLGGQIQAQQFGEKAQQAQAQDSISKFNAANQQQVMGTNTSAANQGALTNLSNAQNVANQNTAIQNQAQTANKKLYQQQYNDQLNQAKTAAGQYDSNADYYGQQADATRKQVSGIFNSVGGGMSSGAIGGDAGDGAGGVMSMLSDENAKTNVTSGTDDLHDFLDKLMTHKYDYKDSDNGEGKHYSPMAQELEETPVGKSMVKDTDEGKSVDYGKGLGVMMAALADQHKRINDLENKKKV